MQNFIDQANKNGVVLLGEGRCQFCGADYGGGIFECMENCNVGLEHLDFNVEGNHLFRFLSVDAHALQHPEIHGRWSNHFHLTRLHLILVKKQNWDYKKSPLLSDYLNTYKLNRSNEFLTIPEALNRGKITSKDLTNARTAEQLIELIKKWAEEVYHSWNASHVIVSKIAEGFIEHHHRRLSANG